VRAGQGGLSYQYNKRIEIPMEVYLTVLISITAMLGLIALGIGLVIIAPSSLQQSLQSVQKS
jgi:hypothetical protein